VAHSQIEKLNRIIEKKEEEAKKSSDKKVSVDSEIQCDLMKNLLVRTMKGEKGLLQLPEKFPDIGNLIAERKQQSKRILELEGLHNRCTCPNKNSKFSSFKLNHKLHDSPKSDR